MIFELSRCHNTYIPIFRPLKKNFWKSRGGGVNRRDLCLLVCAYVFLFYLYFFLLFHVFFQTNACWCAVLNLQLCTNANHTLQGNLGRDWKHVVSFRSLNFVAFFLKCYQVIFVRCFHSLLWKQHMCQGFSVFVWKPEFPKLMFPSCVWLLFFCPKAWVCEIVFFGQRLVAIFPSSLVPSVGYSKNSSVSWNSVVLPRLCLLYRVNVEFFCGNLDVFLLMPLTPVVASSLNWFYGDFRCFYRFIFIFGNPVNVFVMLFGDLSIYWFINPVDLLVTMTFMHVLTWRNKRPVLFSVIRK